MACSAMTKNQLRQLSRQELQALARLHGIDSSLPTQTLRELLEELHKEGELSQEREVVAVGSRY